MICHICESKLQVTDDTIKCSKDAKHCDIMKINGKIVYYSFYNYDNNNKLWGDSVSPYTALIENMAELPYHKVIKLDMFLELPIKDDQFQPDLLITKILNLKAFL